MRFAAALMMFLATACNSAQSKVPVADSAPHRILQTGQYGQGRPARQAIVATTDAQYRRLWTQVGAEGEPPAIDFGRELVVFLVADQKPTGGYTLEVRTIAREGSTLVVDAPVHSPPEDAMTIQVLTRPYAIVAVPKQEVSDVRWIE